VAETILPPAPQVHLDPSYDRELVSDVVGFGDFVAVSSGSVVYQNSVDLWSDLVLGRPLPLELQIKSVTDLNSLCALAIFIDRELALNSRMSQLLASVQMVGLGLAGIAHIPQDQAVFLLFLQAYLADSVGSSPNQMATRSQTALQWLRDYVLDGTVPNLRFFRPDLKILETKPNGFAVFSTDHSSNSEAVVEAFRMGFLSGVLYNRTSVTIFRKSAYINLDLELLADRLLEDDLFKGWHLSDDKNRLSTSRTDISPTELLTYLSELQ